MRAGRVGFLVIGLWSRKPGVMYATRRAGPAIGVARLFSGLRGLPSAFLGYSTKGGYSTNVLPQRCP